ncbi:MAG: hypothetical protein L0287_19070 [Anaerolineae bacterium]|nr:hypothetical protein [Anaerolineae bacterium]
MTRGLSMSAAKNELFRRGIPFFKRLFSFAFAFSNLVVDHGMLNIGENWN